MHELGQSLRNKPPLSLRLCEGGYLIWKLVTKGKLLSPSRASAAMLTEPSSTNYPGRNSPAFLPSVPNSVFSRKIWLKKNNHIWKIYHPRSTVFYYSSLSAENPHGPVRWLPSNPLCGAGALSFPISSPTAPFLSQPHQLPATPLPLQCAQSGMALPTMPHSRLR